MKRISLTSLFIYAMALLFGGSCLKEVSLDAIRPPCKEEMEPTISMKEVKELYKDQVFQIQEELFMEGYVISSDRAGNFFGTLHFQDNRENPQHGMQLEMDLRDSHLWFPKGSRILISLKGLYLGKSGEVYKLGSALLSFGNLSVGRLPVKAVHEHLWVDCSGPFDIVPTQVQVDSIDAGMVNTLVQLENMEFVDADLGKTYADFEEETERTLQECNGEEITLLNSGYADFQAALIPEGSGFVRGALLMDNNKYRLAVRDLEDVDLSDPRCVPVPDEFTSTAIFISELADPENNTGARFVELYNAATEALDLNGWTLRRYTNANTAVSSTIDLSDMEIGPQSTLLISPNAEEFALVYGFAPDLAASTNSPADSNGDDNLELVDPFGTVVDVFGIIGEDGSGTNHEFEDGRAVRKSHIISANPIYTFEEWEIYNDTGDAGTTDLPRNAPMDFTPGQRD
ncbi:MAG: DUF5689 domain-containing protein [Sediminicola sp.]